MAFEWYAADDSTPAGTANDLTTSAGTASAAVELHAWLNKGSSVGSAETRHLTVYVEDPDSPGTYKTSGLDILDRREFEIRIIGSQNPDGVPGFSVATTAWTPVGTYRPFPAVTWYPNCCVEYEVRVNPSYEGGASSPATFYVKAVPGTPTPSLSIPDNVEVTGTVDTGGERITGLPLFYVTTDATDAASVGSLRGAPVKFPARLMADAEVTWTDIVTNGDFASVLTPWTGTNWAQSAGTALHTAGATAALTQDVTIVSGVRYKVTVTVTGAAGTVTPSIGAVAGTVIAAGAGTVERIIVADDSGTLALAFTPSSDFDGALDDVVVTATLFGLPTIDGVATAANESVVLPLQTDPAENGKWRVSDVAPWVRHPDCLNSYYLFSGAQIYIREGTANAKSVWHQTAVISDIETSAQSWEMAYQLP